MSLLSLFSLYGFRPIPQDTVPEKGEGEGARQFRDHPVRVTGILPVIDYSAVPPGLPRSAIRTRRFIARPLPLVPSIPPGASRYRRSRRSRALTLRTLCGITIIGGS